MNQEEEQLDELFELVTKGVSEWRRKHPRAKLTEAEQPRCPECGRAVVANGKQKRRLRTDYEQTIELERSKAYCPHCKVSFFPSG